MSRLVLCLLAAMPLLLVAPGGASPVLAAGGPSAGALRAAGAAEVGDVFIRIAQTAQPEQPLQVVVALHGHGRQR